MKHKIFKLKFKTAVHFGAKSLDMSNEIFHCDTLFSALCQEVVKKGDTNLEEFVEMFRSNKVSISDAFPYVGEKMYLPKPFLHVESAQQGDSGVKKAYKKLKYIPIELLDKYLKGEFPVLKESANLDKLGNHDTKNQVAIRTFENSEEGDPEPYRVGIYRYNEGNGLYFILGYSDEKSYEIFKEFFISLKYSGIGGKRSSGFGRFDFEEIEVPQELEKRLNCESASTYMTLSLSLPTDEELGEVVKNANYMLERRGGFVSSSTYEKQLVKKKDLYVFQTGSCVKHIYRGDIYDVSSIGSHPVYKYAIPMFLEVE